MRRAALAIGLLAATAAAAQAPPGKRSGFEDMSPATQAMQRDDGANPGMFLALDGKALWSRHEGEANRSCAACHGADATAMTGVAARYPAFDETTQALTDLSGRVQHCRVAHQRATPWARESRELLAMTAWLGFLSRGAPMAPPADPRLDAARERGRLLYTTRLGQLDLACAQCHDQNAGRRLGGALIPQGHVNGYPTYRLEWQATGSLQRRLRNCMTGVRAEAFPYGAPELIDLEVYLAERSRGLPVETPAVRP